MSTPASRQQLSPGLSGHDQQTIGDAVTLEVALASLGHRFLAFLIDLAVSGVILILLIYFSVQQARGLDAALIAALMITVIALVCLILPVTVEALTGGRSLGKLALGTRVVRVDQGPITLRHSLARGIIGLVEGWMMGFTLAGLSVIFSKRSQRLGDLAAGTLVVRERLPLTLPGPVPMPHQLVGWASQADVASLPPELSMAIRQFLQRRMTLSPHARAVLSQQLLAASLPHVAPPPPPAHPDDILAAILAERGRRDWARLTNDRRRWDEFSSRVR